MLPQFCAQAITSLLLHVNSLSHRGKKHSKIDFGIYLSIRALVLNRGAVTALSAVKTILVTSNSDLYVYLFVYCS